MLSHNATQWYCNHYDGTVTTTMGTVTLIQKRKYSFEYLLTINEWLEPVLCKVFIRRGNSNTTEQSKV